MIRIALVLLSLLLGAAPGLASVALDIPGPARKTGEERVTRRISLPAGPWRDGTMPRLAVEGQMLRQAWRIGRPTLTVPQIADALTTQLAGAGYDILFDCAAPTCGGYDFRFATETLPAPAMFVDLGAYRYVLAREPGGDIVSLLVSRAHDSGYVQVTSVTEDAPPPNVVASSKSDPPPAVGDLWQTLTAEGRAPLDDLLFGSGASSLDGGPFASLDALAAALAAHPRARVVLVGHTDTAGSLEANIALSRRRAESVRDALVEGYGVEPSALAARGVGYLAPRAPNDSEAGRRANRRVEVVLVE